MKVSCCFYFLLLSLSTTLYNKKLISVEISKTPLYVFIHGTTKPPRVSVKTILDIMSNKIDGSLYSLAVFKMRHDPFLYYGQAIQELGLCKVDINSDRTVSHISRCFNLQFDHLNIDSSKFLYYTFGWSGLLNNKKRLNESKILYKQLEQEIEKLRLAGIDPEINLIAYSHGGNVALNLAKITENLNLNWNISNLIMFGAPVQSETDFLINSSIFENIYHFYSQSDSVQALDVFSSDQFFSRRTFHKRDKFKLPSKLMQIKIKITNKIKKRKSLKKSSISIDKLIQDKMVHQSHFDPGHTELWNLKWGAYWYRDKFPLNPISVMMLTPSLINCAEKYRKISNNITLDYCPSEYVAVLYDRKKMQPRIAEKFLTKEVFDELIDSTLKNIPKGFNIKDQEAHVARALKQASKEIKSEKGYRNRILISYLNLAD